MQNVSVFVISILVLKAPQNSIPNIKTLKNTPIGQRELRLQYPLKYFLNLFIKVIFLYHILITIGCISNQRLVILIREINTMIGAKPNTLTFSEIW